MLQDLTNALTLLTVFIAPSHTPPVPRPLGKSLAWFPLVGLFLGAILALIAFVLQLVFPNLVSAALIVALWALLTGGLHLEGLTDSGDGLAATVSRERRLEIMHDPRVGSFGAVTLVVVLLCKFAAVASLHGVGALVLAPTLARWTIVLATTFPPPTDKGMAVLFRQGLGRRELAIATATAALVALAFGWQGGVALVAAATVMIVMARLALKRLGGLNGDVYGAIGELSETAVLLVATIVF